MLWHGLQVARQSARFEGDGGDRRKSAFTAPSQCGPLKSHGIAATAALE
jgi:hypothetical protein